MTALWWLVFNLITIVILAFFSMTEMACVSFNRVRLHYYVSKKKQRAIWLNTLIQNPSMLFGTTLIGVNVAMIVGSECSRQFYQALGLNPDLAPLTQVMIVVIFGELAPMFAARHYPEHVAMLGAPILYGTAKVITPILWLVDLISEACHWLIGGKGHKSHIYLSQEELQKILEEQDEEVPAGIGTEDFNTISTNIFRLREKQAKHLLIPLDKVPMLPSHATVGQLRHLLKKSELEYAPIYHHHENNIIGIAEPRNLLRTEEETTLKGHLQPPWFVTRGTRAIQILKQFRRNNQSVAIVLDRQGRAIGIVDMEDLLEEIFGKRLPYSSQLRHRTPVIDRTLPAQMTIEEFEKEHGVFLYDDKEMSLGELVATLLDSHPEVGDSVTLKTFELTVKETSMREIKTVQIRSIR